MHFSLVRRRLVYWMGTLSWIILLSGGVHGQIVVQAWLDSLSSFAESYSEIASRVASEKEARLRAVADVEAAFDDLDRQREEARIDCLANRLLAEEYQPYDFDIRETMWCKGWLGNSMANGAVELFDEPFDEQAAESTEESDSAMPDAEGSLVAARPLDPIILEFPWLNTIQTHVMKGLQAQLQADWDWALVQTEFFADKLLDAVDAIEEQRMVNHIASRPALRDVFGRSVLPFDVGLSSDEYTTITVQLWNELRANAVEKGVLFQTSWNPWQSTRLEPFYDLVTLIPQLFPSVQR